MSRRLKRAFVCSELELLFQVKPRLLNLPSKTGNFAIFEPHRSEWAVTVFYRVCCAFFHVKYNLKY